MMLSVDNLNKRYQSLDDSLIINFYGQPDGIWLSLKKMVSGQGYESKLPLPKNFNDQKMVDILGDFLKQLSAYYMLIVV